MNRRLLFSGIAAGVLLLLGLGFVHQTQDVGRFFRQVPSYYIREPDISQAENRQLTTEQCNERYPNLYYEADRAKKFYSKGISEDMVDEAEQSDANARLAIIDNKLYVKGFYGGVNTRTQAAMAAVYATLLTSPEPMPDVDFVIQTSDGGGGEHPHFVLDRKADQPWLWLMPDFGFFSWPEPGVGAYSETRSKAKAYEEGLGLKLNGSEVEQSSWGNKIPQLMWRGVPMVDVRQELLRASENQNWSDVQSLDWGKVNNKDEKNNGGDLKTLDEHCQYQFLAHVEGWAYSGRLKYLQQCRSVIVTHDLEWIQHYHHLLISDPRDPKQNVIQVARPLEEHLPKVMEALINPKNAEWVERIAENNWRDMREGYISPAANECYYRYALRAYASAQTFQPKIGQGVAYESFLLTGQIHWDPHR